MLLLRAIKVNVVNHRRISLLLTTYKILSSILDSGSNPHVGEIIEDHQFGFPRNRSTSDHSPPCSPEVTIAWSYTSTSPIRPHGMFLN